MRLFKQAAIAALFLAPLPALAGHRAPSAKAPAVKVMVDHRTPAPRIGVVWVAGYWSDGHWHAGFYRPAHNAGFVWVDGHHDRRGRWVPGYWRRT